MTFETALRDRVIDGTDIDGRVYWALRPEESEYPSIVLTLVSDEREQDLNGFTVTRPTRVQFDCYAMDRGEVAQLREAVIAAVAPPALVDGVQFQRAIFEPIADRGSATEVGFVHRNQFDVIFRHNGS